jgi:methylaspartate ammonia-lyase
MEAEIKAIIPGHNKIAFLNYKGENNCFMNSVFQLFFNVEDLRNCLDAIVLAETKDVMADRLKRLVKTYLQGGENQTLGATKRIITDHEKDTFVDIRKFRKAFCQVYPSVGEMKNTGDAALFWSTLVQIVNSILITGESNKITTVSNPDDDS